MSISVSVEDSVFTKIIKSVRMNLAYKFNAVDCVVYCEFLDKDGLTINSTNVYIPPEEYSLWTSNDDYLINLVLSKLGFVLKT